MKISLLICSALLLGASCSRQKAPLGAYGPSLFDTQVKNAVKMGDGDLELKTLRDAVAANPQDTVLRRKLAAKFQAAGYGDLAVEHLRLAVAAAPQDEDLLVELARALDNEGSGQQAADLLKNYIDKLPETRQAAVATVEIAAILQDGLGQFTEGERLHRLALSQGGDRADLLNNLGLNLARQKRATEAESVFKQALAKKPSYELARNNIANLYATQLSNPAEALLHWKAISGPAAAHNNLAAVRIEEGKFDEAKVELEKALALRFQFPEAMRNLQIVAARTNGTVSFRLERDKKPSGLSKLASVLKQVFLPEDDSAGRPAKRIAVNRKE
jgi:Tfp pilus assembly protein PilF